MELTARSVALVGVSSDTRSIAGVPLHYLRKHGYPGAIHCVNPNHDEVNGFRCISSVEELPSDVDVAVISLPARLVPAALESTAARGVRLAIVVSSTTSETRHDIERAIRVVGETFGTAVLGPSSPGLINIVDRTFLGISSIQAHRGLRAGGIALVGQSGGVLGAVASRCLSTGRGLAYVIGTGEELGLDSVSVAQSVLADDRVRCLGIYLESARSLDSIRRLAEAARVHGKSVAVLKGGRTSAGRIAAQGHTGRLSSSGEIYDHVLRELGLTVVDSTDSLALTLAISEVVDKRTGGAAVVTDSGGTGVLIADALEREGATLAKLPPSTVAALRGILPEGNVVSNPLDLAGSSIARPEVLVEVTRLLAADASVGCIVIAPMARVLARTSSTVAAAADESRTPFLIAPTEIERPLSPESREELRRSRAVLWEFGLQALGSAIASTFSVSPRDRDARASAAPQPKAGPDEHVWKRRLQSQFGLSIPAGIRIGVGKLLAEGPGSITLAPPVVIKSLAESSVHKRGSGLVVTGLRSQADVMATVQQMLLDGRLSHQDYVLVEEMVLGEIQLFFSLSRSDDLGAVAAVGIGGSQVELIRRFTYSPVGDDGCHLAELVAKYAIGVPTTIVDRLSSGLESLAAWFATHPESLAMELNPIIVNSQGYAVVDVKEWTADSSR